MGLTFLKNRLKNIRFYKLFCDSVVLDLQKQWFREPIRLEVKNSGNDDTSQREDRQSELMGQHARMLGNARECNSFLCLLPLSSLICVCGVRVCIPLSPSLCLACVCVYVCSSP